MGKSMRKFKKLAALAITIPTLLSSTNISFAMKSPVQSNVHAPQEQSICISLNQLYLDGQGSVLFNPNVPYDNTYCFITIQPNFTPTNTLNIFIVNSLRHDAYGRIYNENGYFTYNNGQPIQLPLPQQQFEVIPSEQCHYNTVFNSQIEQEEIQEQNEQVEDNKSPKPPKSTQKTAKTRKHCKDEQTFKLDENTEHKDCIRCNEKGCAVRNGVPYTREDGKQMQQYIFKNCRTHFTEDCILCNEEGCAVRNGVPYIRTKDGKQIQQFKCKRCKKTFTRPLHNLYASFTQPIFTQPIFTQPIFTQPIFTQPIFTQPYTREDCIRCNEKGCAVRNGKPHIHKKDGTKTQQYKCKKCKKTFTLDENGKVVQTEYIDCIRCKKKECAARNGVPYTRDDGKRMQQYKCKKCQKTFTQPINKNAEEQAGIETQPN